MNVEPAVALVDSVQHFYLGLEEHSIVTADMADPESLKNAENVKVVAMEIRFAEKVEWMETDLLIVVVDVFAYLQAD